MWLYKYPLTVSYVPTQLLWFIIIFIPGLVLTIEYVLKRNKRDIFEAILCITLIYTLNGFLTSFIKVLVGRPRPDFYERCSPDVTKNDNVILHCTGSNKLVMEGRKSFPSGHSSFSFCSMMFLSLYLAGKLQVFSQSAKNESWKFTICLLPLILATTVAISRTCDYHHHWEGTIISFFKFTNLFMCTTYFRCCDWKYIRFWIGIRLLLSILSKIIVELFTFII